MLNLKHSWHRLTRKSSLILVVILFFFIINLAYSVQSDLNREKIELRVGLIEFPPFSTVLSNGNCIGEANDKLNEIFNLTKYKLFIYCASPSRVYRDFNSGKIDLTINVKTTEALSKNALYSNTPFARLSVSLYEKSNATKESKTISSVRFYSYDNMRSKLQSRGYTFIDSINTKESIAVFVRENDYKLISYKGPFKYYVNQIAQMVQIDIEKDFKEFALVEVESFFTINNKNSMAKDIKQTIDNHYIEQK